MKTMYETTWVYKDDVLENILVRQITVTTISPSGAIHAIDDEGNEFLGSTKDYFESEDKAIDAAVMELNQSLDFLNSEKTKIERNIHAIKSLLEKRK